MLTSLLLDTNILLDVLLERSGFRAESTAVIRYCQEHSVKMFVAWHGLATAFYFLRQGRTQAEASAAMDRILAWAKVAPVGDAEARQARALNFKDFEDAMQAVAADACGAEWIITRNTADFTNSPVPAIAPRDFLARYQPLGNHGAQSVVMD